MYYKIENLKVLNRYDDHVFNAFYCVTLFLKCHFWGNAQWGNGVALNRKHCEVALI